MRWWWQRRQSGSEALAELLEQGRWSPSGPVDQLPLVVFDTETTGFHPSFGDEIIAIAAVHLRTGEEFQALVNPGRTIPAVVTRLTGITDEAVADAPAIGPVLEAFFHFVGQSILVAHTATFDRAFIQVQLRRLARLRWTHPLWDTAVLARSLHPTWGDYSLEHCASKLGVRLEARHTAIGDSRTTAQILEQLLAGAARDGRNTWEAVHQLASIQHFM